MRPTVRHLTSTLVTALCLLPLPGVGAPAAKETCALALALFHLELADQVTAQLDTMAKGEPEAVAKGVAGFSEQWYEEQTEAIRTNLDRAFGATARSRFEEFMVLYAQGEEKKDAGLLAELSASLGLAHTPDSYPALRQTMVEGPLKPTIASAGRTLGAVQTWISASKKPGAPPLPVFVKATFNPPPPADPAREPPKQTAPADLAAAEAVSPDLPAAEGDDESPLNALVARRKDKRDRALEAAQSGMQMVAAERKAAEEEAASKKASDAQAEADNMKAQAEKLAAVEKEALDQRESSWGNRLKNIFSSTVGAATGAFTGGVGARAGEEAVNAVFGKE